MLGRLFFFLGCFFLAASSAAQKPGDSTAINGSVDDYELLFSELDALIDSLNGPRSFFLFNTTVGQNFLSYETRSGGAENQRRFTYAPSMGYYGASGLGVSAGGLMVNDGEAFNPYQLSLAASYDYNRRREFLTGLSFTRFFTKKDLPFYTSPLQNEVFGYFTYRKHWLRPSLSVSYAWGSRENLTEVEDKIRKIWLAQRGFTRISTTEKIVDLNLTASVRHDFYFLKILASDFVRLTPQLSFISGSQQFGFNQSSSSYATLRRTNRTVLYNAENQSFDQKFSFQPVSLTGFLRAEYSKGPFYVQPQLLLDYYFPAAANRFTTALLLSAGLLL